ncbi:hypothetical protein F511_05634 [Dorcoceras hygrometricum]|uniref:Uncharacterized protein n=1 Tax=Dorcoceras hygrometricum TaxID=472368 RepID=A0A2Z7CWW2_9LAMI|nr:hypothetical protein F511_05634 [Dorcoceras hygrometricum]
MELWIRSRFQQRNLRPHYPDHEPTNSITNIGQFSRTQITRPQQITLYQQITASQQRLDYELRLAKSIQPIASSSDFGLQNTCAHQKNTPTTNHTHSSARALNSFSAQLNYRVRMFRPINSEELGQLLLDLTNETAHNNYSSNNSSSRPVNAPLSAATPPARIKTGCSKQLTMPKAARKDLKSQLINLEQLAIPDKLMPATPCYTILLSANSSQTQHYPYLTTCA